VGTKRTNSSSSSSSSIDYKKLDRNNSVQTLQL